MSCFKVYFEIDNTLEGRLLVPLRLLPLSLLLLLPLLLLLLLLLLPEPATRAAKPSNTWKENGASGMRQCGLLDRA
jgi:hypothetical protein